MCRHSYPSVCAAVFPHVVRDLADGAESFSGDEDVSEAVRRGNVRERLNHRLLSMSSSACSGHVGALGVRWCVESSVPRRNGWTNARHAV